MASIIRNVHAHSSSMLLHKEAVPPDLVGCELRSQSEVRSQFIISKKVTIY